MSRILSGIRPSGTLHLGNYLGAIKQWLDLQNNHDVFYMVADLHAVTTPYDPKKLPQLVTDTAIDYLAAGLDPNKATIFVQSHVPAHSQLMWLLNTITPFGELNRMTQWKEKAQIIRGDFDKYKVEVEKKRDSFLESKKTDVISKTLDPSTGNVDPKKYEVVFNKMKEEFLQSDNIQNSIKENVKDLQQRVLDRTNAGILNYPILQAADILAYKPEAVPVGEDQAQHVELARDLAKKFNRLFGQTFPELKSIHTSGKRIMDLSDPEQKMSKSLGGGIGLNDSPEEIKKKIQKAVSSSEPKVIRDGMHAALASEKGASEGWRGDANLTKQFHGVRNLFTLLFALAEKADRDKWKSAAEDGTLQFSEFKPALATIIAVHFAPFQEKRAKLEKDSDYVRGVIDAGNKKANVVAEATLLEVQQKMGLR